LGTRDITAITHVCVVGLRYVGLPLALQFARSAATVVGLDIDENKVKQLNGGASYIKHVAASDITGLLQQECELKKFCSKDLPLYMVPDLLGCLDSLPRTSTDKIDYQKPRA